MYDYDEMPYVPSPNESHVALCFVLDCSGSMQGQRIRQLMAAVKRFEECVKADEKVREILDISVIAFNDTWRTVTEWVSASQFHTPELTASGCTSMGMALEGAVPMVKERTKFLKKNTGTDTYKPWIVLITDGEPTDSIDYAAQMISDCKERGGLNVMSLGVADANLEILKRISGALTFTSEGYDFTDFMTWLYRSLAVLSVSAPDETISLPAPPTSIKIVG